MNDVLKNAFSKLESKLDYGDQTELTDKEIVFLLRYIREIENKNKELQQRIDKAIEYIEANTVEENNGCGYEWEMIYNDYLSNDIDELKKILKGDSNAI